MKKAIILVNPYPNTEAETYQPRRLKEELERLGVAIDIVPNRYLALIDGGKTSVRFEDYAFCVCLDKDKYLPRMLEKKGMRLFNCAEAVELCDDKMLTAIALADAGIPMPKTLPALLLYKPNVSAGEEAGKIVEILGLPVVVKECYGSLGKQVYLAETVEELAKLCEQLKHKPHLYQQFVAESSGRDLRVICVGRDVVAAMERSHPTDFRSNINLGGKGRAIEVGDEVRTLCKKISTLLKLDYCGIDLLYGKDGPLVCEVNSNAFFGGIEEVTGVNVAKLYAEHILKKL